MRHTIRKILIANRGEIACRITRTCHAMGIAVTAVYTDVDADAPHVDLADDAVHLSEGYLSIAEIVAAARKTGADAIHPGYGFLAENAGFAQAVTDAGLIWIGPPPSAIDAMGRKREAKLMLEGIPLVPGYQGEDQSDDALMAAAEEIGFPLMIKASAGGGGKGMRRVDSAADLTDALQTARREALQAFADDTLILETFVEQPRHVEIQIFGDSHGNVVALGERECSIQRRHQKIVEETPSTALDSGLRERMFDAAVSIGQQLGYTNAGTVEFLLDAGGNFYFMEMNTRLQVEHPVTEMVTGVDLVRWQIAIAEGERIPPSITLSGHAIEVRVYAEDPARDFLPATGDVVLWEPPQGTGIRVDDGIRTGGAVTIDYDPMVAKVIAWAETREEAIRRLDYALATTRLFGLRNNIGFLRRVLTHPQHLSGEISTQFLTEHADLMREDSDPPAVALIAAALAQEGVAGPGWRNNRVRGIRHTFDPGGEVTLEPGRAGTYSATIGENTYHVGHIRMEGTTLTLTVDGLRHRVVTAQAGDVWWLHLDGATYALPWRSPMPLPGATLAGAGSLHAPMPGKVIAVNVQTGDSVQEGQPLMILEAMKMEHRIEAPYNGVVGALHFKAGDSVPVDAVLLEIDPADEE
jgi:acetyl/propionyl-CoA carboxylase alpha subunit